MAVVVEDQEGRLLHEQPRDVVEPEIGPAEKPPARLRSSRSIDPALAEQVPQVAAPEVAQGQVSQQLDRRLGVAAVQGRAIQVILIEQSDVPQERQLAVLEQVASAVALHRRRLSTRPARAAGRRRTRSSSSGSMTRSAEELGSPGRGGAI